MKSPMSKTRQSAGQGSLFRPADFHKPGSDAVQSHLRSCLGTDAVEVRYTDNATVMISFRTLPDRIIIRLNGMFRDAPPDVLDAVADFTRRRLPAERRMKADRIIRSYINTHQTEINRPRRKRRTPISAQGHYWNLEEVFRRVNEAYFEGKQRCRVGWSRGFNRTQMGCWRAPEGDSEIGTIRVNRLLDSPDVPQFYMDYLMYHEMLHDRLGVRRTGARRSIHPPEFARLEKRHPDYGRAKKWAAEWIPRLWKRRNRRDRH